MPTQSGHDHRLMGRALELARQGYGQTSPNPMVGAVLTRGKRVVGQGWHERAGQPHAEINALRDAQARGHATRGATLHVTLEPCSTRGRTPPCTRALIKAGLKKVVVASPDPNPAHAGQGLQRLREAGIEVLSGVRQEEAARLNEAFNHWIVEQTPFVTLKCALTLDGKIATASGESKWITGPAARERVMTLRQGVDGIAVGIETILADNPSLTVRMPDPPETETEIPTPPRQPWRIILDSQARTPLSSQVVTDTHRSRTIVVVSRSAPRARVQALHQKVTVLTSPQRQGRIDLTRLMTRLGHQKMTSLLVEGGGEVNASFLFARLVHRIAFFYAPKIMGGHDAIKGVAGPGAGSLEEALHLDDPHWEKIGPDLLLTARVK